MRFPPAALPVRRIYSSAMVDFRMYPALWAGGAAIVLLLAVYVSRKRRRTPEDLERERRQQLSLSGRITDGTVIDAQEISDNGHIPMQLLIYRYDVSGVSYEASQDVTQLRPYIDIHTCRLGLPTSVRYDPQNPGNSIVISEKWIGLRNR